MNATLTTIGTGSSGNCYILDCNGEKLILELGLPWKQILRTMDFKLDGVVSCCVSHIHKDHAFAVPNALSYGLKVFAPRSVCDIYPKCTPVYHAKRYKLGGYTIMPLKVPHGDCEECMSYYIELPDGQTMLFATDLSDFPYNIKGINTIMLEANYGEELIIDRLCNGSDIRSSFNAHMEINDTIRIIKRLNNPNLNKVVLIHLSDGNSDERMFKDKAFAETGVRCEIASAGDIFFLNISDF